jgi:hypothetical protein
LTESRGLGFDAPTGLQTVLQIFAKDKGDYYELDRTISIRTE